MKRSGRAALVSLAALVAIPLSAAAQSYEPPEQANPKDVYCSGFVASTPVPANLRIVMGEDAVGRLLYPTNDYIYLSHGRNGGVSVGQRYLVVRRVNDPNPIKAYRRQFSMLNWMGHLYLDIGRVEVKQVHETTSTALVQGSCDALNPGDVLIPFEERPTPEFKASDGFDRFAPIAARGEGTIVMGKEFIHAMGQGDVIYVNLGTAQGVKVGDYLRAFRYARRTLYEGYKGMGKGFPRSQRGMPLGYEIPRMRSDLPREVLGEAFVVRADQNSSTAVVTYSVREMHAGDFVEVEPPAPPKAELAVRPETITRGAKATLSWKARGAQEAELAPGLGAVSRRGTLEVSPAQTTTYTLLARGAGGSAEASATLTVVQPEVVRPAPPPPAPPTGPSLEELFAQNVADIFFDFNKSDMTAEASATLERAAAFLREHPEARVLIEGHCDEVGSDEYNVALGNRRAEAARDALVALGLSAEQFQTVSLGKSQPFCTESSEEPCRQQNRRAHFVLLR